MSMAPPRDAPSTDEAALAAALELCGWPSSLASKRPTVLSSVAELVEVLLFRSHVDEVFVLRGGVDLLGQSDVLPEELARAARDAPTTRAFLAQLSEETLGSLRGRVYCTSADRRDEKELKTHEGRQLDRLLDKQRVLHAAQPSDDGGVYIGEIRRAEKYRHPLDNRWVKTILRRDVKDHLGRDRSEAMPYWDRYDEGVFVGGRFCGSPLHVDQVSWSNVGKNFGGSKLLAVWPAGEASREMFDEHNYTLFVPPLSAAEERALEGACRVALVGPGDVFVFSGGNAHMALSVSAELSVTAYESFINLAPANLRLFLQSGTAAQYRQCRARAPMVRDIKRDVAESVADLLSDLERGYIRDAALERRVPDALAVLRSDAAVDEELRALAPPALKRFRLAPAAEAAEGAHPPAPPSPGAPSPTSSAAAAAASSPSPTATP